MNHIHSSILRTLAFHMAWGYPPTVPELLFELDTKGAPCTLEEAKSAFDELKKEQLLFVRRGRCFAPGEESLVDEHELREQLFPRKIRKARRVAKRLARLEGVRFVALCNTTALAHARDEGDLDFFVITRRGALYQSRGWSTLLYKLIGKRPGAGESDRDSVCLSFFIDDTALDLSNLMLPGDDPYFRYWFFSLLPLYDDGISSDLWKANARIQSRHPFAQPWILNPGLAIDRPLLRWPTPVALDPLAGSLHPYLMSRRLKEIMNQDTRVMVNDHVLKFHVDDGRAAFRSAYESRCHAYEVES